MKENGQLFLVSESNNSTHRSW